MIRNDKEHEVSKARVAELGEKLAELEGREDPQRRAADVAAALRMQLSDIEEEIGEYEALREGRFPPDEARAGGLDDLGELLIKARIALGLTQRELAHKLEMTQQQIQRYERDGYQKISLWRLAEIADALDLDVTVQARLPAERSVGSPS